jgi:integrase
MAQRGTVRRRGSTWTAYWSVRTPDGSRRQRTKGGFATRGDAQAFLTKQLAALASATYAEPSKLTLAQYLLDYWLPTIRSSTRASTWDAYKRAVEQHIVPSLGGISVQALTAHQLDRFYADQLDDGRLDGTKGLAVKTVRNLHAMLHKALRDAERKQLVMRNVAANADPPKQSHRSLDLAQTWTAEQARVFLDAMRPHRLYAAFLLAATTGMRRGEILGLRWADVDFAQRRAAIRQTVISVAYAVQLSAPKTAKGRRTIAIDDATVAALAEHRRAQQRIRGLVGDGYVDTDLVFAREDGRPIHPDLFSQTFDRAVAKLRLPRIRLHDLRHTHATLGLAAGVPAKIMSERLGHATVAFTQDVYVHSVPGREQEAADMIASMILGEPSA